MNYSCCKLDSICHMDNSGYYSLMGQRNIEQTWETIFRSVFGMYQKMLICQISTYLWKDYFNKVK